MKLFLTLSIALLPICSVAKEGVGIKQAETFQNKSSLAFIENKGQIVDQNGKHRKDIDFKLEAGGMTMFIGDGQLHYQWYRTNSKVKNQNPKDAFPTDKLKRESPLEGDLGVDIYRLDVELIGANKNAEVITEYKQDYYENYYLPQCPDGAVAHSYKKVTYKNVYPHIDWVIYVNSKVESIINHKSQITNELKYDFVVRPGGNYGDIKLQYKGAAKLELKDGALIATTPFGSITENAPYTYYGDNKEEVKSNFILNGNTLSYNITSPLEGKGEVLIIDPQLNWATYIGGSGDDRGCNVAADTSGNVYLVGITKSASSIATLGSFQSAINVAQDGYVAKFNIAGVIQWATYYGSSSVYDDYSDITCDIAGNIYVAGSTDSSGLATTGAYQQTVAGGHDAVLIKFNSSGVRQWATYYGGSSSDDGYTVACDAVGNVYLGGQTSSVTGISTTGAFQTSISGSAITDGFLVKFNTSGQRQWCTYYGGSNIISLAYDPNGFIYAAGNANVNGLGTSGVHQSTYLSLSSVGYVVKFNLSGQRQWCSYYYGTGGSDWISDIAADVYGSVYIAGNAFSTSGIATANGFQISRSAGTAFEGYAAKLNRNGIREWGTYYGGTSDDQVRGVVTAPDGKAYIYGHSGSTSGIATTGGYQGFNAGLRDAFFAVFSSTGLREYATYYGGMAEDWAGGATSFASSVGITYSKGKVYFVNTTRSTTGIATAGAYQTSYAGATSASNWGDGFLVQFAVDTSVHLILPFTDTVLCIGDTLHLKYGVTQNFMTGNVFTVQLSNASGSFTSPVNIGSATSSTSGTINCVIPSVAAGSGYRVRVIAIGPVDTSLDDGFNISINPFPVKPIASATTPLCAGDTLKLTASTTTTGVTWAWGGPNSFVSAAKDTNIINAQTAASGNYIVAANLNGCKRKDTVTVLVNPSPAKPNAASNTTVCPGTALNLTATSATPGVSWSWTGPGSFSSSSQNPTRTGMTYGWAGNYMVTATLNSCSSKDTETVAVVITTPTPNASSNSPLCVGSTLQLTSSTVAGAAYSWSGPGGYSSTTQNPTRNNVQLTWAGLYIVTASINGCVSEPDTATVVINPGPLVSIYPNPNDSICAGSSITFIAVPTNGGTSPVYQWYKNTSPVGTSSPSYNTSAIATGDIIHCTLTNGSTCSVPATATSNSIPVTVLPVLAPTINISSNPAMPLIPNQPVTFTATPTNGGANPVYQWKRNGTDIVGATSASWGAASISDHDTICCVLTSSYFCAQPQTANSNCIIVQVLTGIDDVNKNRISIYPNPVNNELIIEGAALNTTVQLFDILGREVYRGDVSTDKHSINTSALVSGTYVLQLTSSTGERMMYKVVKE